MTVSAIGLFAPLGFRLHEDGVVRVEESPRMGGDIDGWTVATFHVESEEDVHGDHWEVHPAADEVVCVLTGGARLILRAGQGDDEQTIVLSAPSACVVPGGRWHRLVVDGPTDLISITRRNGSRLERRA